MLGRMAPRWRKVLRDLSGSKARTALVVLSIAVGVFAVGTITTTRLILNQDLGGAYRASNPQAAALFTDKPFGEDVPSIARRVDGVADAEAVNQATLRVKVGANEWRALRLT